MMKNILFICTLTALLSACSESRLFKKEEQYTPLCTYFNPLDLDMNIETLMPYFVNYYRLGKNGIEKPPDDGDL